MIYDFDPCEKTIMVHVTQEDISHGIRGQCGSCPIARALKRMFPLADKILVSTLELTIWHVDTEDAYYACPYEARNFIRRFDVGEWVEPFTFTAFRI